MTVEQTSQMKDHATGLGFLVMNLQSLEALLAFFTWGMIDGAEDAGPAVTSMLSFGRLCELFELLAKNRIQDAELLAELSSVMTDIRRLEQHRNTFVHSAYMTSDDEKQNVARLKIRRSKSKGVQLDLPQVDEADLRSVAKDITSAGKRVGNLMANAKEAGYVSFPSAP